MPYAQSCIGQCSPLFERNSGQSQKLIPRWLLSRKWRSGCSRWSESCRSLIWIATLKRALIDCPKRYLNTRRHRRFRQQISLIRWFNPFHPDIRGNHGNIAVRGTSMGTGQAWGQVKYRYPGTRRRWVMIICQMTSRKVTLTATPFRPNRSLFPMTVARALKKRDRSDKRGK
jgi:hypothetical protein